MNISAIKRQSRQSIPGTASGALAPISQFTNLPKQQYCRALPQALADLNMTLAALTRVPIRETQSDLLIVALRSQHQPGRFAARDGCSC